MNISLFVASTCLSAFSMPLIIGYAQKKELYDSNGGRKIHSGNIPRLGGVGMFWSFILILLFYSSVRESAVQAELRARFITLAPFAFGVVLLHGTGLYDDFKPLPAKKKLIAQVVAAALVVFSGYGFKSFDFRAETVSSAMAVLYSIISLGWMVGIPNAINMIDGLDGLAGGLSLIVSLAYAFFYIFVQDMASAFLCLTLAGVIMGFLFVNFPAPKAKIFMGDSGSLFLGFCLASMPFIGQAGKPVSIQIGVLPAVLVLIIPIYDTLRAIVRRILAGKSIMDPDRLHVHHLFFDNGYRTITILSILYTATLVQIAVVMIAMALPRSLGYLLEGISFGGVLLLFNYARSLKYVET